MGVELFFPPSILLACIIKSKSPELSAKEVNSFGLLEIRVNSFQEHFCQMQILYLNNSKNYSKYNVLLIMLVCL